MKTIPVLHPVGPYRVSTFRNAGLKARWTKAGCGTPVIVACDPVAPMEHQRTKWWMITGPMFERMKKRGIVEAFREHTMLGDIFSVAL